MPRVQASCSAKWRRTRARARKAIPKPAVTPSYRRLLTRRPSSSRWQMLADLKPDEFEAKAWRAGRSAHCRAQAAAVLALEHKDGSLRGHWGGHLSRASAIAVRICDENSALAPDTARYWPVCGQRWFNGLARWIWSGVSLTFRDPVTKCITV